MINKEIIARMRLPVCTETSACQLSDLKRIVSPNLSSKKTVTLKVRLLIARDKNPLLQKGLETIGVFSNKCRCSTIQIGNRIVMAFIYFLVGYIRR